MGDFESTIASSFKRLESVQHVIQNLIHQPGPDRDQHYIAAHPAPLVAVIMWQMPQRAGIQRTTVAAGQWTATFYMNVRWQRVAAAEAFTVLRDALAHRTEVLRRPATTLIARRAAVGVIVTTAALLAMILLMLLLALLALLTLRPLLMLLTTTLPMIIWPWGRLQQRGDTDQHDTHGSDQRFWQFHQSVSSGTNSKKGGSAAADLPLFLQG